MLDLSCPRKKGRLGRRTWAKTYRRKPLPAAAVMAQWRGRPVRRVIVKQQDKSSRMFSRSSLGEAERGVTSCTCGRRCADRAGAKLNMHFISHLPPAAQIASAMTIISIEPTVRTAMHGRPCVAYTSYDLARGRARTREWGRVKEICGAEAGARGPHGFPSITATQPLPDHNVEVMNPSVHHTTPPISCSSGFR